MKTRRLIRMFLNSIGKVGKEGKETMEAVALIKKYATGNALTDDEMSKIKEQMLDTLKMAGIAVPFALLPGSSVLVPLIASVGRKYGIDILPSAFSETIVYIQSNNEIDWVQTGDIVLYDGSKWIVEEYENGLLKLDGIDSSTQALPENVRKLIPYLATRKVFEGENCVDETTGLPIIHSKEFPGVRIIQEIERTEYRKII